MEYEIPIVANYVNENLTKQYYNYCENYLIRNSDS